MASKQNTAKIKAPRFPQQALERVDLEGNSLQERRRYEQELFSRDNFSGQQAQNLSFDQILFQHSEMSKTSFKQPYILDSRFKVCDLANSEWSDASFARVELLECHLTGFQAAKGRFQDVFFKDCQAQFAQFAQAKFKSVRFEDCDLSDVNFFEADLTDALFVNCNLSRVDFSSAKLAGADLRGSKLEGVRVGPRELRGAIIDITQAVALVRGMGIVVEQQAERRLDQE
jgi:uncharacterized protein YjbI with pentapeptide repeats